MDNQRKFEIGYLLLIQQLQRDGILFNARFKLQLDNAASTLGISSQEAADFAALIAQDVMETHKTTPQELQKIPVFCEICKQFPAGLELTDEAVRVLGSEGEAPQDYCRVEEHTNPLTERICEGSNKIIVKVNDDDEGPPIWEQER